jgi:AcrR family transcriptional regulator
VTKTPRTRTPSAGMAAALISSAADILETEGPDGLSVRRIAAVAGVAPMGVYNHFKSKFGIVEALYIQGFERLREATASIEEIQDPYEGLRECGRRYRSLALGNPRLYQIMFQNSVPGFEPSEQAFEAAVQAFGTLVNAVRRAMAAGVIAEGQVTDIARILGASVHGWVSLELLGIGFVQDQDAVFDHAYTALLRGLRP